MAVQSDFHLLRLCLYKCFGLSYYYLTRISLVVLTPLFIVTFETPAQKRTHAFPSLPAAMYVARATGWISCAIPYGGLSRSIWSQPWMKEPVSHHRFVLLHLSRATVAHFPLSLRPYCQPTDAMPFKLPLPVVHCLPHSCTSQQPPHPPLTLTVGTSVHSLSSPPLPVTANIIVIYEHFMPAL